MHSLRVPNTYTNYGSKFMMMSREKLLQCAQLRGFWKHSRHVFMVSPPWSRGSDVTKEATCGVSVEKSGFHEIVTKERYKRDAISKKTGEFHPKGSFKRRMVGDPLPGWLYDETCRFFSDRMTIALGDSPINLDDEEKYITYGQNAKLISFAIDVDELPTEKAEEMLGNFIEKIGMKPSTALIHDKRGYSTLQVKWILETEFWADSVKKMGSNVGRVWDALYPSYPCDKAFRGFILKNHWFFESRLEVLGEKYRFFSYGGYVSERIYGNFVGRFFSIHEDPYLTKDMVYDCMAENMWDGDRELDRLLVASKSQGGAEGKSVSGGKAGFSRKPNLKGNAEKADKDMKGRNSYVFRLRAERFVEYHEKFHWIGYEDYKRIITELYEEAKEKTPNGKLYGMPPAEQIEAEARYCSKKHIAEWRNIVYSKREKAKRGLLVRKLIRFLKAYSLGFLSMNGNRILPDLETVSMIRSSFPYAFRKLDADLLVSSLEKGIESIDDLELLSLILCRKGKSLSSVTRSKQRKAFSGNWMEEVRDCVESLKDGIVDSNALIATVETVLNVILFGKEAAKTKGWGYVEPKYEEEDYYDPFEHMTDEELVDYLCKLMGYTPSRARRALGIRPPPKVVK